MLRIRIPARYDISLIYAAVTLGTVIDLWLLYALGKARIGLVR